MTKEELQKKVAPKLVRKALSQDAISLNAQRARDMAKYLNTAGFNEEHVNRLPGD